MNSGNFQVETSSETVVLAGFPKSLREHISVELKSSGLVVQEVSDSSELKKIASAGDLDYLVIHSGFDLAGLNLGSTKSILIGHFAKRERTTQSQFFRKQILYLDYLGADEISSNYLEKVIYELGEGNKIPVPGDGLSELSILTVADLANMIALAILNPSVSGQNFVIGNPELLSHLNLAYLVLTSLPFKAELKFESDLGGTGDPFANFDELEKNRAILGYKLSGNLEKTLKTHLSSHLTIKKPSIVSPPNPPAKIVEPIPDAKKLTPLYLSKPVFVPRETRRKKLELHLPHFPKKSIRSGPPRLRTIVGRGVVIALALYLGTLAFTLTVSILSLKQFSLSVESNSIPRLNKINTFSFTYLRANWVAFSLIPGISGRGSVREISLLLDAYAQAISAFDSARSFSDTTENLVHYVFGSGEGDIAQLTSLSRLQAEELYQKLSLLDGSLPSSPPGIVPEKYQDNYKEAKSSLTKLKKVVTSAKAVLAITPDVIGLGGRRKYGVLFQNNMELRSTGGFIGSFAILSFENGKMYDLPVFDVYDADGQLKGHVEPPKPIKDILGEANWYLRDSNFDPDFPTSARRAEWFIKKSLNMDLDGTIAVNVNTISSLLTATGPLTLTDYNETITAENLYERSQFHAEVNFFPGSTQKKEFLSTVVSAIFAKLPTLESGAGLNLSSSLSRSLEEKNTLISLANQSSDRILNTLGWTGQIKDLPCPGTASCYKDYAMVVDNNYGVNKANYFIKRSIEEVITFDKNLGVNHVLRLSYQNTSTSTAWPSGAYKNYQRVYLPIGVNVSSIKVDGKPLETSSYTITSEHDKTIVAYLLNIPISSTSIVEIDYSTTPLSVGNDSLYTWVWQKQPGTSSSDPLTVYLNYPMYLKPVVISPAADLSTQQLKFNFTNDTDHRLSVKFTK